MNRVQENLIISDIETVHSTSFDADTVISVCQDEVSDNVGCRYRHFPIADREDDDYGGSTEYDLFNKAVRETVGSVTNGAKTVVHCHVGKSRSAAVCIAAVSEMQDCSYSEAYSVVHGARPVIDPKPLLVEHANRYILE